MNMHKERKYVHLVYLAIDILLFGLSFYLPYVLRYKSVISPGNIVYFRDYNLVFFSWGLALIFFLNNEHLYTTDRTLSIPKEIGKVMKAVVFSAVIAGLVIFLLKLKFFSRFIFGFAVILLLFTLSLWRISKRAFIRHRIAKGLYNINVLILGAGKAGVAILEEIKNNPFLGLNVVGFLDDKKIGPIEDLQVLGKIGELENIAKQYFVDEIYITFPSERQKVAELIFLSKKLGKTVRIVADNFDFPFGNLVLNYVGLVPLLAYHRTGLHGSERLIKRFLDVIVAGAGVIVLFPFLSLIALLIELDSPGPIFYISKRCGKKGKIFNFYKFRSMFEGADKLKESLRHRSEVKGPIFKIKDDPRITALGRYLRRYSLDELPQLINVLRGEMSLVGPRPPTPDEVKKYDFWQMRRLDIRPGITCLSQVKGRSDLSFYRWVKWDLWYIDNWTLGLDLKILLWTIAAVLKRKGAY